MMLAQRTAHKGRWLIAILAILAVSVAVLAQQGKKIDDNALKNAAKNKEEWISYNRDWSETRYSPLDQINATNVSKLGLAWSLDIPNVGTGTRQEATNMVANGVLYSITPSALSMPWMREQEKSSGSPIRQRIAPRPRAAVSSTVVWLCMKAK
jgi:glucose dehydrogenase